MNNAKVSKDNIINIFTQNLLLYHVKIVIIF